jgi:protein-S-isoprenylcysteine O-methyltransferase Ste14
MPIKKRMVCFGFCEPNRMTRCGIGPWFSIITVISGVLAGWLTHRRPELFTIHRIPFWFLASLASVLVFVGMVVYIIALRRFNQGYKQGELVTQGPFAVVRHPIYAAWILLICPGAALFFRSWPMLMLPVVAYIGFKAFIHREDRYLKNRFGQAYQDYRACTNELFPVRFFKRITKPFY